MKTTITLTVDADAKEKAMPIIQNSMDTTLSKLVNDLLIKISEEEGFGTMKKERKKK